MIEREADEYAHAHPAPPPASVPTAPSPTPATPPLADTRKPLTQSLKAPALPVLPDEMFHKDAAAAMSLIGSRFVQLSGRFVIDIHTALVMMGTACATFAGQVMADKHGVNWVNETPMTVWDLMSEVRSEISPGLVQQSSSRELVCAPFASTETLLSAITHYRNQFEADCQAFHPTRAVRTALVRCFGDGIKRFSRRLYDVLSDTVNAKLTTKAAHLEWGPAVQAARELIFGTAGGAAPPANAIREVLGLRIVPHSPATAGTPPLALTSATPRPTPTFHTHLRDPGPWAGPSQQHDDDVGGDGERALLICYNCRGEGHMMAQCPERRVRFDRGGTGTIAHAERRPPSHRYESESERREYRYDDRRDAPSQARTPEGERGRTRDLRTPPQPYSRMRADDRVVPQYSSRTDSRSEKRASPVLHAEANPHSHTPAYSAECNLCGKGHRSRDCSTHRVLLAAIQRGRRDDADMFTDSDSGSGASGEEYTDSRRFTSHNPSRAPLA